MTDKAMNYKEALAVALTEKWTLIGNSTEASDKELAEEGVRELYAQLGLKEPDTYLWFDDPLEGDVAARILPLIYRQAGKLLSVFFKKKLHWEKMRYFYDNCNRGYYGITDDMTKVSLAVRTAVSFEVDFVVEGAVDIQIDKTGILEECSRLGEAVTIKIIRELLTVGYGLAADEFSEPFGEKLWNHIRYGESKSSTFSTFKGAFDASTLVVMDLLYYTGYASQVESLNSLTKIAASSGWWWPFENVVVMTAKPCEIKMDESGRLHSEDGMAITYPSGWGFNAWHGVRVPEEIIRNPDEITADEMLAEKNSEVRRVMMERFGVKRFIAETKSKVIDKDDRRELYEISLPNEEPIVLVRVQCPSTQHEYFLRVPPSIRTCHKAVAWTFGIDPEDYKPVKET